MDALRICEQVVVAWGAHGERYRGRVRRVVQLIGRFNENAYCIGTTKSGQPKHPLYVKYDTERVVWDRRKVAA